MSQAELGQTDLDAVRKLKTAFDDIKRQLTRVIVGQDEVIEELLIAMFSKGHCILEGVPGLAKTLMISTLARCLSLDFSRIQFTPDLMPSDITGTRIIEEDTETRRVLRAYAVFNADQCDGLPEMYRPAPPVEAGEPEGREARLDHFFASIGAALRHHGSEAYYEPAVDRITMPPATLFDGYDHYYATLAHELSHWTGHGSRLARDLKNRFGSEAYAAEELIAELSAAILGAELGLPVAHLDSHASYIAHWLELLRSDERAILTAAARAEEAAAYLLTLGDRSALAPDNAEKLAA